jgi:hypothetical protein
MANVKRGIYILANDDAIDQSVALANSIKEHDSDTSICLIPYDEKYKKVTQILTKNYNVQLYPDINKVTRLSENIQKIFGDDVFARPNQFRKQACWLGPFDEFLYVDTDIVVFDKLTDMFMLLKTYDFVCSDYERKKGIRRLFKPEILNDRVISQNDLSSIFNAGFWGSKKKVFTEKTLLLALKNCRKHFNYFDFTSNVSDMPVFNYIIMKKIKNRINLTQMPGTKISGDWAGMPHFIRKGDRLYDPNSKSYLKYLHWAGIKIRPGCPYWDVWKHYRLMGPGKDIPMQFGKKSIAANIKNAFKKLIKQK